MDKDKTLHVIIISAALILGLAALGLLVSRSAITLNRGERTVVVKGLSEKEVPANIVIWPIAFTEASNDLTELYEQINTKTKIIRNFLKKQEIKKTEITVSSPKIEDKYAQSYSNSRNAPYRYVSTSRVTVYSENVKGVIKAMNKLVELGRKGITLTGPNYDARTEFLFTKLNEVKPGMIQEATKNAREVATKFATDSDSKLGKIKKARQGQFSIANRDSSTPNIKKVRVVSTVEYYLTD
ncbi:MAG: SIMPL domain-containing protein [Deltaproteobacteria bacterium]|jgi:uncharacterized protein|nr:SIMPL domain-containing protein [Deltaproteobacteria bacterium]